MKFEMGAEIDLIERALIDLRRELTREAGLVTRKDKVLTQMFVIEEMLARINIVKRG
jgi:hypothetical protein